MPPSRQQFTYSCQCDGTAGTFGGGILNGGEGIRIIPAAYPAMQMVMPVGGFLTLGFVIAGSQKLMKHLEKKKLQLQHHPPFNKFHLFTHHNLTNCLLVKILQITSNNILARQLQHLTLNA